MQRIPFSYIEARIYSTFMIAENLWPGEKPQENYQKKYQN